MQLLLGECRERLSSRPPESVDLLVTDPPYRLVGGGQTSSKNLMGGFLYQKDELSRQGKLFTCNDIKFSDWLPSVFRVLKMGGARVHLHESPQSARAADGSGSRRLYISKHIDMEEKQCRGLSVLHDGL